MFLPLLGQRGLKGEGMGLGTSCFAGCAEVVTSGERKEGERREVSRRRVGFSLPALVCLCCLSDNAVAILATTLSLS
jgi:hypothetical protein